MPIITQVCVFGFGAIVGSFLNAVIWRLRTGESFIVGRSYCPSCRHELTAVDLVPVLSYILLGGRCRHCRKPIGTSYLFVEIAMGLLFLLSANAALVNGFLDGHGLAALLFSWYLFAVFAIVFVYDLKYLLILRSVTLPATAVAAVANIALGMSVWSVALGAVIGFGFFWLQFVVSKGRWIGGGDMWLGLLIGAALGWKGLLVTLFLSYVIGALVGGGLILAKRKQLGGQMPFGTFLSAAAAVTVIYGEALVKWYWGSL